ncbi:MAG: NUDIX hydrolase [Pseudomonadota bacterium]
MTYPKLAALAVVLRTNELLLVRRKNEPDAGKWGFPGGHVDFGEGVGEAACRELHEETTICAEPAHTLTGLETIVADAQGGTAFHYYLVAVRCDYIAGEPQARDDVYDARWISHRDIFERSIPLSEDVDTVLGLALRDGNQERSR